MWENTQQITGHYVSFSEILRLKKAMSKRAVFCFKTAFICYVWKECK